MTSLRIKVTFELEDSDKKVEYWTSAKWNKEIVKDLKVFHSVDAVEELKQLLVDILTQEFDRDFLTKTLNQLVDE